jgi:hypothetical protein
MRDIVNVNVVKGDIMLIQKKLISSYDYELRGGSVPFYFRLEIHQISEGYSGTVFRLDRYRLSPTFPTNKNDESDLIIDDALLFVKDEFIDCRDLIGFTEKEVVDIFLKKLDQIFNFSGIKND